MILKVIVIYDMAAMLLLRHIDLHDDCVSKKLAQLKAVKQETHTSQLQTRYKAQYEYIY